MKKKYNKLFIPTEYYAEDNQKAGITIFTHFCWFVFPIFSYPIQHKQTVMIFCLLWSGLERFFIKLRDWSLTPTQTYCVLLSILYKRKLEYACQDIQDIVGIWVKLTFHHELKFGSNFALKLKIFGYFDTTPAWGGQTIEAFQITNSALAITVFKNILT